MGMTIEEAIRYYEDKNVVLTEEEALANTIAIETMRKYQQIEKIVQACGADYNSMDSYECVEEIARILKHGND